MGFAAFMASAAMSRKEALPSEMCASKAKRLACIGCGAPLDGGNGCSYCRLGFVEQSALSSLQPFAPGGITYVDAVDWRYVVRISP